MYINVKTGKEATEMELSFAGQQLINQRLNKGAPVIDSSLKAASYMAMKSTVNGETWALYLNAQSCLIKTMHFNGVKELIRGAVYSGAQKVIVVSVGVLQPLEKDTVWQKYQQGLRFIEVELDDYIKVRPDVSVGNFSFLDNNLM